MACFGVYKVDMFIFAHACYYYDCSTFKLLPMPLLLAEQGDLMAEYHPVSTAIARVQYWYSTSAGRESLR